MALYRLPAAVGVLFILSASVSGAQVITPRPAFSLTGKVVAEVTGFPLPYATVTLDPGPREKFTDETGSFKFYDAPAGAYRVHIRQLGYIPVDTTVQFGPSIAPPVFSLVRIPTALAQVQVSAPPRRCIVPDEQGLVDDEELTTILGEARKNADRERLLRKLYPFEYRLAQRHDTYDKTAETHLVKYDTMTFRSDDAWGYRKGKIVSSDRNKLFGDVRVMRLPTLGDLADKRFLTAHCFKYAGIEQQAIGTVHRIDFQPLPNIIAPDVEGSIFLDSATYIIRKAEFRLTRGGSIKPAVLKMEVITTYREILPNVALFDEIRSVQPLPSEQGSNPSEFRQTQQLLSYKFLHGGPPGAEGEPARVSEGGR
ncbi:MAG TPA: carboxypeptidase regulatory-like domain-containing protein [Gemmatimonadaceae bacterium]